MARPQKKQSKQQKKVVAVKETKGKAAPVAAKKAAVKDVKEDKTKKVEPKKGDKAEATAPVAAAPQKPLRIAPKPIKPPRDEDDDGFDDLDADDDFIAPPKAAAGKKGAAIFDPARKRAGGAAKTPRPEDLVDEDEVPVVGDLEAEEEDELGDRGPRRSAASEADAAALEAEQRGGKKKAASASNAAASAKDKLIELGKQKGFVTYDEVNDAMPEDVVSTDQIDSWLSALGDHGIEVVDGSGARRPDIVDQILGARPLGRGLRGLLAGLRRRRRCEVIVLVVHVAEPVVVLVARRLDRLGRGAQRLGGCRSLRGRGGRLRGHLAGGLGRDRGLLRLLFLLLRRQLRCRLGRLPLVLGGLCGGR